MFFVSLNTRSIGTQEFGNQTEHIKTQVSLNVGKIRNFISNHTLFSSMNRDDAPQTGLSRLVTHFNNCTTYNEPSPLSSNEDDVWSDDGMNPEDDHGDCICPAPFD